MGLAASLSKVHLSSIKQLPSRVTVDTENYRLQLRREGHGDWAAAGSGICICVNSCECSFDHIFVAANNYWLHLKHGGHRDWQLGLKGRVKEEQIINEEQASDSDCLNSHSI